MKINAYIMDHMDNADLSGVAKAVDLLATLAMHSEDMQKLLDANVFGVCVEALQALADPDSAVDLITCSKLLQLLERMAAASPEIAGTIGADMFGLPGEGVLSEVFALLSAKDV